MERWVAWEDWGLVQVWRIQRKGKYCPWVLAFILSLISSWWQDSCHILNITTISQGISWELSTMRLNFGESQAVSSSSFKFLKEKIWLVLFGIGVYSTGVGVGLVIQTGQVWAVPVCSGIAIMNWWLSQRCVWPCPLVETRDVGMEKKDVGETMGWETSLPRLGPPIVTFELFPPWAKESHGLPGGGR